jgi:hypothetical protein
MIWLHGMDWSLIMELAVAIGTWALVIATICLVRGQLSVAKEQRKVQLYLELRKNFDGPLISARKSLARQLSDNAPHGEIKETVMDFFEDMGMLIRRQDFLDRDMVWSTFSFYATHWWSACKDYISEERQRLNDNTLFSDFEYLIEEISKQEAQERGMTRAALGLSASEVKVFLQDEAGL